MSALRSPARRPLLVRLALGAAAAATLASGSGCATAPAGSSGDTTAGRPIPVVAVESCWGSIAAQLGGEHVRVTSIITNPNVDPHDYEPTVADARAFASARYVIVNGVGYDDWASKLLAADPGRHRTVLTVGDLVGVRRGGNPHRWYSPADVHRVIERVTADYRRLDPADAGYFDRRKSIFEKRALARYDRLIADIRATYAGTPVGASESVVTPLAEALGLKVLTPQTFLDAISEGSDPTAADKAVIDRQIATRQIEVYLFNIQNSTPDVRAQVDAAKAAGIPVVAVTETLTPSGATFQDWQVRQLSDLERALARATGKQATGKGR